MVYVALSGCLDGDVMEHADEKFKSDEDLVFGFLKKEGGNVSFISSELQKKKK